MNRALTATTPLGEALWPVDFQGTEALSSLFEFRVGFKSEDPNLDCQAMIGEACALRIEAQNYGERFLHGQMVRFFATGRQGEHWRYQAILAPKLWHASRRANYRIWQNRTVQEIVDEVLGLNGIRYEWRLKNKYKTWEYLTQYRESDMNFISRLLEHEGIYYWFEHSADSHNLVLGDHFSVHEPFPGYERSPYYPPDSVYPDEDHFSGWQMEREVEPGRYIHTDYDFKRPSADLTSEFADPRGHLFDHYEVFDYPGDYIEPKDGESYAQARLEAMQANQERLTLEGRVRGAAVGRRIELFNHPREDQNRELLIVRAVYALTNNSYEGSGGSQSATFNTTIEAIPADRQFRPPQRTPKPRTYGPETAVVTGPEGSEIHTDEFGRVKVKFFWDRYGKRDGTDSCWIRVAYPWAGSNYGGIYIPRVTQEVIVDFEHGDPDRPIIIGRVYNAEQMPPWDLPANKTQSGVLTRSSTGGSYDNANAIRFEDKKGGEEVWVHAERDLRTTVENNESHSVGANRTTVIKQNETTVIGKDRKETVGENHNEVVSKNIRVSSTFGDITISADRGTMRLQAAKQIIFEVGDSVITMNADGTIDVVGPSLISLNPDGPTLPITPFAEDVDMESVTDLLLKDIP